MNNLKYLRKEKRLTLTELADRINIGRSTLNKIELGIQTLNVDQAITLADFFKCSLDELVGRDFIVPEKTIIKTVDFTYKDILAKLSSLTKQEIHKLNGAIEMTLENMQEQQYVKSNSIEHFTRK